MNQMSVRSTQFEGSRNLAVSRDRVLNGRSVKLPAGTTIVSADNHWTIYEDVFYERAPAELKERMPRIWTDKTGKLGYMGVNHKNLFEEAIADLVSSFNRPGFYNLDARMVDLDADGVAMEIVHPQWLMFYLHHPDLEAREWTFRIYNEYMADLSVKSKGRFFPVGIPNYWDMSKARESVQHIKSLGLKTVFVPVNPGPSPAGEPVIYASREAEPLWSAIEETGLPVTFHIGENPRSFKEPGGVGIGIVTALQPFRLSLSQLIFGGILDRHPGLRVVFAEAGISWIPGTLQDAEMTYDSWGKLSDPQIKLRPTEYWQKHCYATFQADAIGLRLLDYIGEDHVMWATDYPHNEGVHGYADKVIEDLLGMTTDDQARKILGGNAIKVYGLPQ